jgi:DNA repair exonuclease SbcCD ATPase subunit
VEKLEKTLESLAGIPDRMTAVEDRVGSLELQIVQLRTELKEGFSAVRSDLLEVFDSGSRATQELFTQTWTQMRVLHEEVISRIARLGEGRPAPGNGPS